MRKIIILVLVVLSIVLPITVFYDVNSKDDSEENQAEEVLRSPDEQKATDFVVLASQGKLKEAYQLHSDESKSKMSLSNFKEHIERSGINRAGTPQWSKKREALPGNKGFKIFGLAEIAINRSVPHIGDLIEGMERRHDQFADFFAGHIAVGMAF